MKKLRTKEQHELMRMSKKFQNKQLPKKENNRRDRNRPVIFIEVDEEK